MEGLNAGACPGMKMYCRKVLWWLTSRRSVGSAAWHTALDLEIFDAFVVRPGRPKLGIDRLALDLLDRGSGTDSYG